MNKRIKAKWLKALRSGEFKQCTGDLTDGSGGYCCLGVLQKVITGEEPPRRWSGVGSPSVLLPAEMAFIDDVYFGRKPRRESAHVRLAAMNDAGKSFKQIAAWIERYL